MKGVKWKAKRIITLFLMASIDFIANISTYQTHRWMTDTYFSALIPFEAIWSLHGDHINVILPLFFCSVIFELFTCQITSPCFWTNTPSPSPLMKLPVSRLFFLLFFFYQACSYTHKHIHPHTTTIQLSDLAIHGTLWFCFHHTLFILFYFILFTSLRLRRFEFVSGCV